MAVTANVQPGTDRQELSAPALRAFFRISEMWRLSVAEQMILLGITGYITTGSAHPTALIPAGIGLFFVLFGVMANTEDSKRRMLWMHISVTVALLVFLGMIPSAIDTLKLSRGASFPHPIAVEEKGALCLLSLIYVLFCVRSFISARRARLV